MLSGCQTGIRALEDRPLCSWELWAGWHQGTGIVRTQDKKTVNCADPIFDNYVCLTNEDLENLLNCGGK